jgi:hypothetical protein
MLNSLTVGYCPLLALSLVSMLATVDAAGQTCGTAYAHPDVEAAERSHRKAETLCVVADTVRGRVVTVLTSCHSH